MDNGVIKTTWIKYSKPPFTYFYCYDLKLLGRFQDEGHVQGSVI